MKRIKIAILVLFSTFGAIAQTKNLNTAVSALNQKELDVAKAAIDAAAEHEDTKNMTKMWMYRGQIYLAIDDNKEKYKGLDPDAKEKAYVAFLNCLKGDKEKKIYTKDVTPQFMATAARLSNRAIQALNEKDYAGAVRYYNLLNEAFPFDVDNGLAQRNITKDGITYNLYLAALYSKDNATAKKNLQVLIDKNYKNPSIYIDMSNIYLQEKDTAKALTYIEKGRAMFEDNVHLINAELAIYLEQKKTDVLLSKINTAIEASPDNEILHFIAGSIYEKKNDASKAEEAYKKALEIKPDYADANYNLGVLYYGKAVDFNNKANALPPDQTAKFKDFEAKRDVEFKKAMPLLEKALEANPKDKSLIQVLKKLYTMSGETEKYNKLKEQEKK